MSVLEVFAQSLFLSDYRLSVVHSKLDYIITSTLASFWGSEATCTTSHLYYICRVHQSLAIFTIFTDGSLELTGRAALHSDSNARNLTLSGRHILVASQDASAVEVFALAGAPEGSSLERTCSEHSPCATDVAIV